MFVLFPSITNSVTKAEQFYKPRSVCIKQQLQVQQSPKGSPEKNFIRKHVAWACQHSLLVLYITHLKNCQVMFFYFNYNIIDFLSPMPPVFSVRICISKYRSSKLLAQHTAWISAHHFYKSAILKYFQEHKITKNIMMYE